MTGFPLGLQLYKLAGMAFAPFGKKIVWIKDVNPAMIPRQAAG